MRVQSSKTLQKNVLQKNHDERFCKKIDKTIQNLFFLDWLLSFIAFLGVSDPPWYYFGLRGTNQPRRGPSFVVFVVGVGVPLEGPLPSDSALFGFCVFAPGRGRAARRSGRPKPDISATAGANQQNLA
jgi:hypothetical protein